MRISRRRLGPKHLPSIKSTDPIKTSSSAAIGQLAMASYLDDFGRWLLRNWRRSTCLLDTFRQLAEDESSAHNLFACPRHSKDILDRYEEINNVTVER